MTDKSYDAIVIGGGPGGYVAAIRMGQLGQKVLVVDKEYMGGTCLNWGCIPSKAIIYASGLVDKMRHAESMGITVADVKVDVPKMQQWKAGIVKKLTSGVTGLVKSTGGTVVFGNARLTGAHTVLVEKSDGKTESFVARKGIVLATGASPIQIPAFKVDGEVVISAREAVSLQSVPRVMVLIGGGIIGMELGMAYQKLGTKVIVVEMLPRLLNGIDEDLVAVVQKRFVAAGGELLLSAKAKSAMVKDGRAAVEVEHEGKTRTLECDKVLVAVGFRPNSANLGLEGFGVKTDQRGHIAIDDQLKTTAISGSVNTAEGIARQSALAFLPAITSATTSPCFIARCAR